jgi:hypothetical protein
MHRKLLPLALAATMSLPTLADEAAVIKKAVETKLARTVTSVTKTPLSGPLRSLR